VKKKIIGENIPQQLETNWFFQATNNQHLGKQICGNKT
jgi:hypothetical protein